MPGYIERFEKLSPDEQKQDLDNKIRYTKDAIAKTRAFADLLKALVKVHRVATADPTEWDIEKCRIDDWQIDEASKEIHCTVKYFAVHNTLFDIEESRSGRQFRGSMTAVIDDSGAVRYKKTPPIVRRQLFFPLNDN